MSKNKSKILVDELLALSNSVIKNYNVGVLDSKLKALKEAYSTDDGKDIELKSQLNKTDKANYLIQLIDSLKIGKLKVKKDDEQDKYLDKLDSRIEAVEKLKLQLFANSVVRQKRRGHNGEFVEDIDSTYFKPDYPERINTRIGVNAMGFARGLKSGLSDSSFAPEEKVAMGVRYPLRANKPGTITNVKVVA